MKSITWLQAGACGGDSMSLLGMRDPDLVELTEILDLEVGWHPSLSPGSSEAWFSEILTGRRPLDILCVEGSLIRGPGGTGMFDTVGGRPRIGLVKQLAERAHHVVAVGTCSAYGGIPVDGEVGATGLQFHRERPGGLLGEGFRSGSGRPVINLPGCPCPPWVLGGLLAILARDADPELDELGRPAEWFGMLVHQGCTRNEYHEFRVEDHDFGSAGCMFFHLGCLGPLTPASCNKTLWASRTSRTRIGVPCVGCARPDFPRPHPFFRTREMEGVPLDLPLGWTGPTSWPTRRWPRPPLPSGS
jgi:NiFe hydrogenase small subunit HydA